MPRILIVVAHLDARDQIAARIPNSIIGDRGNKKANLELFLEDTNSIMVACAQFASQGFNVPPDTQILIGPGLSIEQEQQIRGRVKQRPTSKDILTLPSVIDRSFKNFKTIPEPDRMQMILQTFDPSTGAVSCVMQQVDAPTDRFSHAALLHNVYFRYQNMPTHMQVLMQPGAVLDIRVRKNQTSMGHDFRTLEIDKITLPQRAR